MKFLKKGPEYAITAKEPTQFPDTISLANAQEEQDKMEA